MHSLQSWQFKPSWGCGFYIHLHVCCHINDVCLISGRQQRVSQCHRMNDRNETCPSLNRFRYFAISQVFVAVLWEGLIWSSIQQPSNQNLEMWKQCLRLAKTLQKFSNRHRLLFINRRVIKHCGRRPGDGAVASDMCSHNSIHQRRNPDVLGSRPDEISQRAILLKLTSPWFHAFVWIQRDLHCGSVKNIEANVSALCFLAKQ